jgi:hypothetical protein
MNREELTIDFFRPEDAEGVARLFRMIYGEAYPAKIIYHPDELIRAVETRTHLPIVVRTSDHRVIGYSSLFRSAPHKGVYEKGNGAVDPDFRNAGIMNLIFQFVRRTLPDLKGISVLFGEPVCNHPYIQKAALANIPFTETAIEIDLMPGEAYVKENSAAGRVSTLLMFLTLVPRFHTVHIPPRYQEYCDSIYAGLDDQRQFILSREAFPPHRTSRLETEIFGFAKVARLSVLEAAADFEKILNVEEQRLRRQGIEVIQVWLKMSCPWIGQTVTVLKKHAFFFGGILPQWFGEDGLLMQKVLCPPNWEGIHLVSNRAKKILEFIRADWSTG